MDTTSLGSGPSLGKTPQENVDAAYIDAVNDTTLEEHAIDDKEMDVDVIEKHKHHQNLIKNNAEVHSFDKSTHFLKSVLHAPKEYHSEHWEKMQDEKVHTGKTNEYEQQLSLIEAELKEQMKTLTAMSPDGKQISENAGVDAQIQALLKGGAILQNNTVEAANTPPPPAGTPTVTETATTGAKGFLDLMSEQLDKEAKALASLDPNDSSTKDFLLVVAKMIQELKQVLQKIQFGEQNLSLKEAQSQKDQALHLQHINEVQIKKMRAQLKKMHEVNKIMKIVTIVLIVATFMPPTPVNLLVGTMVSSLMIADQETGGAISKGLEKAGEALTPPGCPNWVGTLLLVVACAGAAGAVGRIAAKGAISTAVKTGVSNMTQEMAKKMVSEVTMKTAAGTGLTLAFSTGSAMKMATSIVAGISGEPKDSQVVQIMAMIVLLAAILVGAKMAISGSGAKATTAEAKAAAQNSSYDAVLKQLEHSSLMLGLTAATLNLVGSVEQYQTNKLNADIQRLGAAQTQTEAYMSRLADFMKQLNSDTGAVKMSTELQKMFDSMVQERIQGLDALYQGAA